VYCPQCRVEYRDGFSQCSDCQVALVSGLPPETPAPPLHWVTVFESNDMLAIGLAQGSLEDSGIPFLIRSEETAARLVLGPVMFPPSRFLVPKDREVEARELMELLQSPQG
jgi:hypothetical protein